MWWLGCTGIWVKSEGSTNICIDLWCGSGKRTKAESIYRSRTSNGKNVWR